MLVGTTNSSISAGGFDVYVVRTDAQGELQWAHSYGGPGDEAIGGIANTSDGGIVVAGSSASWASPDSLEPYLLKIDAAGDPVWSRTYGSSGGFNGVASTPDGGFIMVGSDSASAPTVMGDLLVVRVNSDGDTLWTRSFDTPSSPPPFWMSAFVGFVRVTSDGGCIIGGGIGTAFIGNSWSFLLSLTPDGTLSWANTYGLLWANDLRITADGDLLVLGPTTDLIYNYPSVAHITAAGIPLSIRGYSPASLGRSSLQVFDDNSVAICGVNTILRTDAAGDVLWAKEYTPGSNFVWLDNILMASDGDLVTIGYLADTMGSSEDAVLIKTEDGANGCGMGPLTASSGLSDQLSAQPMPLPLGLWTGEVEEVVTQVGSGGTTFDICIGSGVSARAPVTPLTLVVNGNTLQVSNAQVGDRYALFDGMGRTVREGRVAAEQFMLPMAGLAPGAYTLRVSNVSLAQTKRFVWSAY